MRARPGKVAARGDRELTRLADIWVERIQVAAHLEDQRPGARLQVLRVELLEARDLPQLAGGQVVRPDVHREVAIGEEEDLVPDPDGVFVVRAVPGQLFHLEAAQIDDADRVVLAAPVVPPLGLPLLNHLVDETPAVRRELALVHPRERHRLGASALDRHGPKTGVRYRRGRPARREHHAPAVVRPAADEVGARVPGQPPRLATGDRHGVDVDVAVVLTREGHRHAVGREVGLGLGALKRRQPPRHAAVTPGDPDIVGVDEGDTFSADRGAAEQPGLFVVVR